LCANTQTAAIDGAPASFGIRHTGGARAAIQEARAALKLSWRYVQAFEAEAAQLYAQPMDIDQVRDFTAELVDVAGADSRTAARNRSERASAIVKLAVPAFEGHRLGQLHRDKGSRPPRNAPVFRRPRHCPR
jgi:hypothetical protein